MDTTLCIEKDSAQEKLLKKEDYLLVDSGHSDYIFLSNTLKLFKITNPQLKEYFKVCRNPQSIANSSLSEENLIKIGQTFMDLDKKAPSPEEQPRKQDFLILNATNGCNLACKYCFAKTEVKNSSIMTLETAQKAIQNMLSFNPESETYSIYFFGGEPMLQKQLVKEITNYAYQEIVVRQGKKVSFLLNTNGTLFTPEILTFFREHDFTITVSIDGPQYLHDENRIYLNGKGSFERVMTGIKLLKEFQIRTTLRPTFNAKAKNLVEIFDFFENLQLHYSYAFSINSKEKLAQDTRFEEDEIEHADKELKKVMDYFIEKIKKKEPIYCSGFNQKISSLRYARPRKHGCEAGRASLTVDESGDYYACQNMLPFPETKMGNIHSGINDELRNKYKAKNLSQIKDCERCQIRNLCGGGCEVECFFDKDGEKRTETQRCHLNLAEWKNILYAYSQLMEFKKENT